MNDWSSAALLYTAPALRQKPQEIVARTRTKFGDRSFAVQGPRVWNSLPAELRDPDIAMGTFRNRPKTFLFDMQLWTLVHLRRFFSADLRYTNVLNNNNNNI